MSQDEPSPLSRTPWWVWGLGCLFVVLLGGGVGFLLWPVAQDPNEGTHFATVRAARRLLDRGEPAQALELVARIRDERPGAGEAMGVAGLALVRLNQLPEARLALERALKLEPKQAEATKVLAAIYLARGDSARGTTLLKAAAELDPDDARPLVALGKVYHDLGELALAAEAYGEALKREPENLEARIGRIRELLADHRPTEATPLIEQELTRMPDSGEALGLAAAHAQELGQPTDAFAFAEKALAVDEGNVDARIVSARYHLFKNEAEAARIDLERVLEGNPNHLQAMNLLSQALQRLGRSEEAAEMQARHKQSTDRALQMDKLSRAINDEPENASLRWKLGELALEGGQETLAYQCFQAALDVDPNYQPALDGLKSLKARGFRPSSQ